MNKEETKEYMREWREKNPEYHRIWQQNNRKKLRKIQKKYYENNRDKYLYIFAQYREKNQEKIIAQRLSNKLYPSRQICNLSVCNKLGERHHPDYSKPSEIIWLCRRHHKEKHINGL